MTVKILNAQQKQSVLNMISEGKSKALVARHFNVSSDTITRVIHELKSKPEGQNLPPLKIVVQPGALLTIVVAEIFSQIIKGRTVELDFSDNFDVHSIPYVISEIEADLEGYDLTYTQAARVRDVIATADRIYDERCQSGVVHPAAPLDQTTDEIYSKIIKGRSVPEPETTVPEIKAEDVIWSGNSRFLSMAIGDKVYNADASLPGFKAALMACVEEDFQTALNIINTERAVEYYASKSGNVRIQDGLLYWKDLVLDTGLTRRIIQRMQNGEDFEFFIPFLENLMLNPRRQAVIRLYDFLEANDIEITERGTFYAWKKVNSDYTDIASRTFDNSPGKTCKMERNMVDEDDERTCSAGLHVCSKSYLPKFGYSTGCRIMKVEVHPMNVVSIPVDYNNAKMRTCEYTVVSDCTDQF